MQRKAKANSVVTSATRPGFVDITVLGAGVVTLTKSKVHQDNRDHAEDHGWIQRLSDGAALGAGATPQAKFDRISSIRDHYESGSPNWNLKASSTGQLEIIAKAIMRGMNKTPEQAKQLLQATMAKKNCDLKGALTIWEEADVVAQAISDIRAERAQAIAAKAKMSAVDMEAEMMGGEVTEEDGE